MIATGLDGPVALCGNSHGAWSSLKRRPGARASRLVYLAALMLDTDDEVPGSLFRSWLPEFLNCQRSAGSARGRSVDLPADGQRLCPFAATSLPGG